MNNHLDSIDQQIAAKHLLTHPFYLAWTRGELSKDALRDYAQQYYHHVAAFPTYLSAVHARCEDQPTRRKILSNLIDEEAGRPKSPRALAAIRGIFKRRRDRCRSGGETAGDEDIDRYFPLDLRQRFDCGRLAALYAYESQIPAVSESKIEGLKKHYGFNDPKAYEYFTVHVEADREHSATEREMLGEHVNEEQRDVGEGRRRSRPEFALGFAFRRLPPARHRLLRTILIRRGAS